MSKPLTLQDLKEVENISWNARTKWREIGIQLKIDYETLNVIECDCDNVDSRFDKMLSTWLIQINPEPTWTRLSSALKSKPVDREDIAQNIERENLINESISTKNEEVAVKVSVAPPRKVATEMEELENKFSKLIRCTYDALVEKNKFSVSYLRSRFSSFPSRHRHEHQDFLENNILKMQPGTTADDLWLQICYYGHFINYGLLKFIIDNTGCKDLISDMQQYEEELNRFCKETNIHDFVKCFPVLYRKGLPSANNHELNVKVGDNFKLSDLNNLENAFVTTFSLPEICGVILKKIFTGCFNITWMVPVHYAKLLRWKLSICDEEFFKKHDIKSVSLDGEECYFKGSERTPINPAEEVASNMEITHEEFELLNMMEKVVKSSPPFTVTQLCTAYTCKLLTHHLSNHPVYGEKQLQIHKFSDLPPEIHRQFIYLSRLAYERSLRKLRFSRQSRSLCLLTEDIDGLGLTTFKNSIHMFIHETLQCYLAAVHVSTTITDGISEYAEKLSPYIKAAGYLPYFVAGLTKLTFMDEVFTILKENVNFYLMSFEANDPDIAKKNFSSSKIMTLNMCSEAISHFIVDSGIYTQAQDPTQEASMSVDSGSRHSSTRSHLSVDSGSRHSSTRSHLSVDSGSRRSSTRSHLSVDSGSRRSSTRSHLSVDSGSRRSSTRSHLSVDSGSRRSSTRSHLSVDSGLGIHSSSTSTGSHLSADSGSRRSSTRSHLSVDSGSRHSSTRSHLSVDSGLGIHSSSTSTGSHLSADSGSRRSSTRSHLSVDSGSRHSSTRSHLSVDSGLGIHSSSTSTGSHLSADSGSRRSSTRSHLSVDSGSRHSSTRSHLSVDSGLGIHSSSTSTGSQLSDVDSGLGIHSGSSNSDLGIGRMRASMFHLYSSYIVGWGMYFSNSSWQLFDLFHGSLSTEGLTQGLIAAAESVYNYQGLTLPQRNFKLSLELTSYGDIEWLTYMPYNILHRIDAVNFIELLSLIQDHSSHINALFESLLSLREVKFESITDCELLNCFIVALRQNASQVTNFTLLECSTNKGIYHELAKMLQANTALKELDLSRNEIGDEGARELAKMLQANTALKELDLSGNRIEDEGACELAKMLQANTALKELDLSGNGIGDEGACELAKMLQANTALKELDLSWNGIGDEGACELAKMLQANTALKELDLSWNGIGDEGACELAKMLQANTALKELDLSWNGIGDEGACELAKMLQANTALKELDLSWNRIGDEGACELAKMLQANTALKELDLSGNGIGDEGACELAKMLQANTALKELDLSRNRIGDEGACELAKMLQANTALKELDLSWNGIGDEGACELAKMLQANTALKELDLSRNRIGDEGTCELAKMLQVNTALKEFNLSRNEIGDEGACELAKRLQANTALKELNLSRNKGAYRLANTKGIRLF